MKFQRAPRRNFKNVNLINTHCWCLLSMVLQVVEAVIERSMSTLQHSKLTYVQRISWLVISIWKPLPSSNIKQINRDHQKSIKISHIDSCDMKGFNFLVQTFPSSDFIFPDASRRDQISRTLLSLTSWWASWMKLRLLTFAIRIKFEDSWKTNCN